MSLKSSQHTLRRMRQKIFNYSDEKEKQADRVLTYLKARMFRELNKVKPEPITGQWSGLTQSELAKTGTCETDWI